MPDAPTQPGGSGQRECGQEAVRFLDKSYLYWQLLGVAMNEKIICIHKYGMAA